MMILRTVLDGSPRAGAILLTQRQLTEAMTQRRPDAMQLAPLTLVETTRGVRTVRAIIDSMALSSDCGHLIAELIAQAYDLGMWAVAEALRTEANRIHVAESTPFLQSFDAASDAAMHSTAYGLG